MNGYTMLAESYKMLMNEGKIKEEIAEKKIRIYEFLAKCDIDDLCIMVDSSAFNEIIQALIQKAVKEANGNQEYKTIIEGFNHVIKKNTAKEVLNYYE